MQELIPQWIRLNIPFIVILLIAGLSVFGAVWLYRRTTPELTANSKYLLGGIRALILFLVLFLFFTPRLNVSFQTEKEPYIGLFIDNSKSMSYEENGQSRWNTTIQTLEHILSMMPENARVKRFKFNRKVEPILDDSVAVSAFTTNFEEVIKEIKKENFDKAFVISDGNHNEGTYPISEEWASPTQIYSIGIGYLGKMVDLSINNVVFDPVVYLNKENRIELQIESANVTEKRVLQARLYAENQLIASRKFETATGNFQQSLFFKYSPAKTGLQKLRLEIDKIEGENNTNNNRYIIVQNVLPSRIRVGIMASVPSFETKFLKLVVSQVQEMEAYHYIEMSNGQFYETPDVSFLDSLDALILCGYPGLNTTTNNLNKVKLLLEKQQVSLLLFLNKQTALNKLEQLLKFLPFQQLLQKNHVNQVMIENPLAQSIDPILYLFSGHELNNRFWAKLPPLELFFRTAQMKPNTNTLISGRLAKESFPIIQLHESQTSRSVVFNGQGFWKWHFLLQDSKELMTGYSTLLHHLLRWSTDRSKFKAVKLETHQPVANMGDEIQINGYLYDANFKPIRNGELAVQALWNNQEFTLEAINDSSGKYIIEFMPPGEGKYIIYGRGFRDGIELGRDRLELEVISTEKEFVHLEQNVDFLSRLAAMGRGIYVDATNIDSLRSALQIKQEIIVQDRLYELWYKPVLLFLILGLLTMEWIIRKRMGLV